MNKDFLMLDTGSMDFSVVDLPPGEWTVNIAILRREKAGLGCLALSLKLEVISVITLGETKVIALAGGQCNR